MLQTPLARVELRYVVLLVRFRLIETLFLLVSMCDMATYVEFGYVVTTV